MYWNTKYRMFTKSTYFGKLCLKSITCNYCVHKYSLIWDLAFHIACLGSALIVRELQDVKPCLPISLPKKIIGL